ncbi:MAG: M23 family metallopeptidase [Bacteroidales bacterium]|jgi:murein DD-endopeptidase MepM/ murein hydrolase activator NlpD|nr:M23 family metallopeptidase [Bacteroidales bacterium]
MAKKNKYRFSREQLKFVEDKLTTRGRIWLVVKYLLASILLTILYYFVFSSIIYTGKDRRIMRQNRAMQQEYRQMQKQLVVLNGTVASLQERDRDIYHTIFNADPPDYSPLAQRAASYDYDLDTVNNKHIIRMMKSGLDTAVAGALSVRTSIDSIRSAFNYLGKSVRNIPSLVPIGNFTPQQVGASVGKKINPFFKSVVAHNGLDLPAASGTEILAPADGVVEKMPKGEDRSSGKSFSINHQNGYHTRYANVGIVYVRAGQSVKQGMVIGRVGMSGMSMAPHLHYEVVFNGRYMNPVNYFFGSLDLHTYMDVISAAQNTGQSLD